MSTTLTPEQVAEQEKELKLNQEKAEQEQKEKDLRQSIEDKVRKEVANETRQAMATIIEDANRKNAELNAKLDSLSAPPPRTDDQKNKDFYANPTKTMEETVERIVKKAIAPLERVAATIQVRDSLAEFKENVKNRPQFRDKWDKIEGVVDGLVQKAVKEGAQLSENLVYTSAIGAVGLVAAGFIENVTFDSPTSKPNTPPINDDKRPMVIPPHLAPSNAPAPRNPDNDKPKHPEPTENQRRAARAAGLTIEEYFDATLNADGPMKLASWKPKGGK